MNTKYMDKLLEMINKDTNQSLNSIKNTLDDLDTITMSQDFDEIIKAINDEILKKFEGSRHEEKIKSIFSSNFEVLKGYFTDCMAMMENKKSDVLQEIYNSLENKKELIMNKVSDILEQKENESKCNNSANILNIATLIYDEEFVKVINSLSSTMKDFFKHTKNYFSDFKLSNDRIIEEIENTKNQIKQLSNISKIPLSNTKLVMSQVDKLSDYNLHLSKQSLSLKNTCLKFYDDSKIIFKEMKNLRNEKMEQVESNVISDKFTSGGNFINNIKNINPIESTLSMLNNQSKSNIKVNNYLSGAKINNSISPDNRKSAQENMSKEIFELKSNNEKLVNQIKEIRGKLIKSQAEVLSLKDKTSEVSHKNNILSRSTTIKTRNNKFSNSVDKLTTSLESLKQKIQINQSRNSQLNQIDNFSHTFQENNKNKDKSSNELFTLADNVINLIKTLEDLQENINNKSQNVVKLKKSFESKKQTVLNMARVIISDHKEDSIIGSPNSTIKNDKPYSSSISSINKGGRKAVFTSSTPQARKPIVVASNIIANNNLNQSITSLSSNIINRSQTTSENKPFVKINIPKHKPIEEANSQINNLQSKIKEKESIIETLERKLKEDNEEKEKAMLKISKTDEEISKLSIQINKYKNDIDSNTSQIAFLNKENSNLTNLINKNKTNESNYEKKIQEYKVICSCNEKEFENLLDLLKISSAINNEIFSTYNNDNLEFANFCNKLSIKVNITELEDSLISIRSELQNQNIIINSKIQELKLQTNRSKVSETGANNTITKISDNIKSIKKLRNSLVSNLELAFNENNSKIKVNNESNKEISTNLKESQTKINALEKSIKDKVIQISELRESQNINLKNKQLIENELINTKEVLNNEIEALIIEKSNMEVNINELKSLILSKEQKISLLEKSLIESKTLIDNKESDYKSLSIENNNLNDQLKNLKDALIKQQSKSNLNTNDTIIKKDIELKKLVEENSCLIKEKDSINKSMIKQKEEINDYKIQLTRVSKDLESTQEAFTSSIKESDKMKEILKEKERKLFLIEDELNVNKIEREKFHSDLMEYKEKQDSLINENEQQFTELKKISFTLDNKNIEINELKNIISKIKDDNQIKNNNIQKLTQEIEELKRNKEKLNDQLNKFKQENEDLMETIIKQNQEKESIDKDIIETLDKNKDYSNNQDNNLLDKTKLLNEEINDLNQKIIILEKQKQEFKNESNLAKDKLSAFKNSYLEEKHQMSNEIQNKQEELLKQIEANQDLSNKIKLIEEDKVKDNQILTEIAIDIRRIDKVILSNKNQKEIDKKYNSEINNLIEKKHNHLIPTTQTLNDLKQSTDSYLKTVDSFKKQIEDITINNNLLQEKLEKALNKLRKYKYYNSNYNSNFSHNSKSNKYYTLNEQNDISNSKYDILSLFTILENSENELKFVLLCEKNIDKNDLNYSNTRWVSLVDIGGESYFNNFNKSNFFPFTKNNYNTENPDKDRQISDLLAVNEDMLEKLEAKQDKYDALLKEYNRIKLGGNETLTNKQSFKEDRDSKLLVDNMTFIELSKHNKIVNDLKTELDKLKTVIKQDLIESKEDNISMNKSVDGDISDYLDNNKQKTKKESQRSLSINRHKDTVTSVRTANLENSYKETINNLENDQDALIKMNNMLKTDIKKLKEEKDLLQKKYNESISLLGGSKDEIANMISVFIEKILLEVTLTNNTKELFRLLLRTLNYPENRISELIDVKKKKSFFGN